MSDSIKVAIKVRPLIKREKDENLTVQWTVQGNSIVSTDPDMKKRGDGGFCFDHIFDMHTTNSDIFDVIVKPIVNAAVNGFNGTVFAYGQTSSGKTYTMMGTMEEPGIIPLAIEHMFDAIANTVGREFLLRVSYLEIYNERVNDLLNKSGIDLKLKEDASGQVIVQCKEEITNSPENVLSIMKKGDKNRRTGETNMNERSSRSHTIFRITIESREAGGSSDGAIQVSQLNLVDLAGSERARQTGATGERFKEGRHINMSLSTLGLVIMQLSESQDGQKYVNFRDSKLTRLLQTSLGGNAMTVIICAVTPAALDETQCTLSFASRAKSVKNKPQVNEVMSDAALLKRYAKQLTKLQEELERIKNENRSAEMEEMESKLQEKDRINQLLEERIELLKTRIVSGDIVNEEKSFKCKSKRRQTWGGPGLFNQHLPVFQPKTSLPTIKEVSFEKPERKSIIQSLDIMNQTFQTAFADFELELFESERDREYKLDGSDSEDEPFITKRKHHVTFKDDVFTIKCKNNSLDITPEMCDTSTQTASYEISPSTPKQVLRQRINDLTKEFTELREFTTLEKQLICQENHCFTHENTQRLSAVENHLKHNDINLKEIEQACYNTEYISDIKKRLTDLNLTEEKNIHCIIIKLCEKLNEVEKQNCLEVDARRETMERYIELEKQLKNVISERNEFEYISHELRAELKKKTIDIELKNMAQENVKQQEINKISELEKKIESITSEKNQLERINIELHAELSKKIAELQNQTENNIIERNEFEHIRCDLYKELDKKSLELEKLNNKLNDPNMQVIHDRTVELEKEIENMKSEKKKFEYINTELESKMNIDRVEKQRALEQVSELKKYIEELSSNKKELQCNNIELKSALDNKITDLESKLLSEQTINQKLTIKISELESQTEHISSEKKELEHINTQLNKHVSELTSTVTLQETIHQQATEKISKLEKEIETIRSEKSKEESDIELHSKLNQKITELVTKVTLLEVENQRIVELEKQIEILACENTELEHNNTVLNQQIVELNNKITMQETENQKAKTTISDFESQITDVMLEKSQLERTANELRIQLNQKTSEIEANKILEQKTENQETIKKISKLEDQLENMISENKKLECITVELRTELNQKTSKLNEKALSEETEIPKMMEKISDLEKQIVNMMSEKNELERVNNELQTKLNRKTCKTERKTAYEKLKNDELMEMISELEIEIESITSSKCELERVNIELHTKLNQKMCELELKIASEQRALETIVELNKEIENIKLERNTLDCCNKQLNIELKENTSELQSKIISEQAANIETMKDSSYSKEQIKSIIGERNELDYFNHKLSNEPTDHILELELKSEHDNNTLKNCIQGLQNALMNMPTQHQDLKDELENQSILSCSKVNESNADISSLIVNIEVEKSQLEETLHLKSQELEDIKDDVRGLKTDIQNLQDTIYLLTTENMEISTKLTIERENAKQTELNLQKTIDELYTRISEVTSEKINLESDLVILKDQLESMHSKIRGICNEEELVATYQSKIDRLTTENIELSNSIIENNKELENVKESKSLLYDHECIYKEKVTTLTEKNKCLLEENNELSTDLIDKIEENDMLKEQCTILKNKIEQSLIASTNFTENDIEHLKAENNVLKIQNAELKIKITILSDENAKFSNNLLDTMDHLDSSCKEKSCDNSLHLSTIFKNSTEISEDICKVSQEEDYETLKNKVTMQQNKIDHLICLNKKLSDLKLTSCIQCAHLRNLNETHRALKLEAKMLNQKLQDLQEKFDRKCVDFDTLEKKPNQDLNLSQNNVSLNASSISDMDVLFVEEKIQSLNDDLLTLKTDYDNLSTLYEDKCNELKKLQSNTFVTMTDTNDKMMPKNDSNRNENRMCRIQNYIDKLRDDLDEIKKNSTHFTAVFNQFTVEKANLLDEINTLKEINEELQRKITNNENIAMNRIQILENELDNMNGEIEQISIREKEFKKQKLMLEVELETLKVEEQNKNVLITDLNEQICCLKNELDTMLSHKNELLNSDIVKNKEEELECFKKQCKDLQQEKVQIKQLEQHNISKIQNLEAYVNSLQEKIMNQESLNTELQQKMVHFEQLLQGSEQEKHILTQQLQAAETEVINFKNNTEMKYRNEFDKMSLHYQQCQKEYENNLQKLNDTLNKYIDENLKLSQELTALQTIKQTFNEVINEKEQVLNIKNKLDIDNEKLKEQLNNVKEYMIKELQSLKCNLNFEDISNKSINEIFIILLQTFVSKEGEIIKSIRETFEKDKQKLEDEKQQCIDTEKRTAIWAKELEVEIEKLHSEIMEREHVHKEYQNKISQLENLLKESTHEKEMLKEKFGALESDFNNLQTEFEKQCTIDIKQEEAMFVAQKREREVQEKFKNKEMELESKMKTEKNMYEKKVNELIYIVESYKTKNFELNNNIEGLEANEKQLKNIIEANSIEIKRNNQNIEKMNVEIEQLTQACDKLNQEIDQKNLQIEEITAILKTKCDILSEYNTKLETVLPEYDMLKQHVKEQTSVIQRYKEDIELMRIEREKQLEIIKDKLNSEEVKNAGLSKQLNELNNKNISLLEELNDLRKKYEELQETNEKLERKIRNSTSKIKAEAEIEELKELNKRLQNNLEGATNRVVELQEAKNQTFKELVELKGKYELTVQENNEMKTTLSLYKSKHFSLSSTIDESKYDALLLEKNKIALELEDKKLILNQKDKEIQKLTHENKELDEELEQYAAVIQERDTEISKLEAKLYSMSENTLVHEVEQKLKSLNEENEELKSQVKAFKIKLQMNAEMDIKSRNEETVSALKKENLELQLQKNELSKELEAQKLILGQKNKELEKYINEVRDLTTKNGDLHRELAKYTATIHNCDTTILKSQNNSCLPLAENHMSDISKEKLKFFKMENKRLKSEIEELQMKLRMSLLNDGVTLRKENTKQKLQTTLDITPSEQDKYQQLRDKIRELELEIVSKNGKIATLEIQIQSENFPYQKKCKELEELLLVFRNKNAKLNAEIQKLQRTVNDVNAWECDICRRWRVNRKDEACQTIPNSTLRFCSSNSGIVEDYVKIQKLEKEKNLMKDLCRSRSRRIKELEERIKELEEKINVLEVPSSFTSKMN